MLPELKPRPFCGWKAEFQPSVETTYISWVKCTNCGSESNAWGTKELAAEAWNTRVKTDNEGDTTL